MNIVQPRYATLGAFNPPTQPTPIIDVHRRAINEKQEELRAAYERITQLEATLTECQSYFESAADVVDGSYGEPAPNREISLLIEIDEVLA